MSEYSRLSFYKKLIIYIFYLLCIILFHISSCNEIIVTYFRNGLYSRGREVKAAYIPRGNYIFCFLLGGLYSGGLIFGGSYIRK